MDLFNITVLVKNFLETVPATRNDDDLLWVKVLEKAAEIKNIPDFTKTVPFRDFLFFAQNSGLPHFKSVSRVRRKLQRIYPELRGTKETQAARSELEEVYREYAQNH